MEYKQISRLGEFKLKNGTRLSVLKKNARNVSE